MFNLLKNFQKVGSINASEWIKKNPNKGEERLVYPEIKVEYNNPKTIDDEIHPTFISLKEEIPPFYVRKIYGGKCFTGNGLVLSPDNIAFNDYTAEEKHPLRNKRRYKFNKAEKINGKVAILATDPLNINYFHWIIEIFPRLHLLEKTGIECDKYIISCSRPFQNELLKYTNIPEHKFIDNAPNRLIQADELIIPDMINNSIKIENENGIYYNAKYLPDWVSRYYEQFVWPHLKKTEPKRIFIGRNPTKHRKLENESEVMDILSGYGFEKYLLEELTVKEQAELFYNAEFVIAPHGAGLVNLLFSQNKTKVLELFSEEYLCNNLQIIAKAKSQDYFYLVSKQAKTRPEKNDLFRKNIYVDVKKLKKTIDMINSSLYKA